MDFNDELINILKSDDNFVDENGNLINSKIINDALKDDDDLLKLLLSNDITKNYFFKNIDNCYVFNKEKFTNFVSKKYLNKSYTSFKNKIGLNINNSYLNELDNVSLFWPFKDCILKGGMSYEDKQKKNEIFFNETLAKDEIDRLLDPKVFTDFKCCGNNFINSDIPEPIHNNNFLIKGNNLLVLHSLLKSYRNKIKLIFIDPPYNTKGAEDTFTYNNNFKESTWLTFMKNRLEVSKSLLRDDGFIAITINHVELFYLGILADEIFGRDNRVGLVSIIHKPEGVQHAKFFSPSHEFMLVYAKNKHVGSFNKVVLNEEKMKEFDQKDEVGNFKWKNFIRGDTTRKKSPNRYYPIYVSKDLKDITLENKEGYFEVYPIANNSVERVWITKPDTFLERLENNELRAIFDEKNDKINIEYKIRAQQVYISHWTDDRYNEFENFEFSADDKIFSTIWDDKSYNATSQGTHLVNKLISGSKVSYPKSLYIILDTLKIMTKEDDIILDFFSGSGTTGHATLEANKLDGGNRKFILVEQLQQHVEVSIERLCNAIKNENYDDNFIYCELAEYNEKAIKEIHNAENTDDLLELWEIFSEKFFLNYELDISNFNENIEEFKLLDLDDQKQILFEFLNKNQLYVNLSEMNDSKFDIDDKTKEFNNKFYNRGF